MEEDEVGDCGVVLLLLLLSIWWEIGRAVVISNG
jgi:hypothetical protein